MQKPTRFLEDSELLSQDSAVSSLTQHSDANKVITRLVEAHRKRDADHDVHYVTYDANGRKVTATLDPHYRELKIGLLVVEVLVFLFFLSFSVAAFGMAVVETDIGSGTWPIGRDSMIATIVVYGAVGLILLTAHVVLSVKFSRVGEDQLDDLLANSCALITMFVISVSLLAKYFALTIDDSADDHSLRRLIYVVIQSYGLFALIIVIRALSRHLAVSKEVVIAQTWRTDGIQLNTGVKDGTRYNIAQQFFLKSSSGKYFFLISMGICTGALLGFTLWFLIKGGIATSTIPNFHNLYLSYFIVMGLVVFFLWVVWVAWSVESKILKGSFSAHFDVYYMTHTILPVVVIFMLIGYRYVYSKVPDDFFDTESLVVPALKFAYFQKIVIVQLLLLPLMAMGVAKGSLMLSNMMPIDIHKYKKLFESKLPGISGNRV